MMCIDLCSTLPILMKLLSLTRKMLSSLIIIYYNEIMCFEENWKCLTWLRRRTIWRYYVKPASATTGGVINRHAVYIHTYHEHEATKPTGSGYMSPSLIFTKRDRLIIIPLVPSRVIGIFDGKLLSHLSRDGWIIITNNNDRNRVIYLVQPPPISQSRFLRETGGLSRFAKLVVYAGGKWTLPPPSTCRS